MPRVGFEPTISAGERPKTYALDRAATGTGFKVCYCLIYEYNLNFSCQLISVRYSRSSSHVKSFPDHENRGGLRNVGLLAFQPPEANATPRIYCLIIGCC